MTLRLIFTDGLSGNFESIATYLMSSLVAGGLVGCFLTARDAQSGALMGDASDAGMFSRHSVARDRFGHTVPLEVTFLEDGRFLATVAPRVKGTLVLTLGYESSTDDVRFVGCDRGEDDDGTGG